MALYSKYVSFSFGGNQLLTYRSNCHILELTIKAILPYPTTIVLIFFLTPTQDFTFTPIKFHSVALNLEVRTEGSASQLTQAAQQQAGRAATTQK